MQELRLVAVSEDGTYLVLATAGRGTRFTLPVDDRLRAAVRGHFSRLGQFEIEVESPLRPKEIQARIRAGETAEEIAESAGIPVERVRWFEGPVLQEREYMAQQAQRVMVRRQGESSPGPPLGEMVEERLGRRGVDLEDIEWDSCKCEDNTWRVRLSFFDEGRPHAAEWVFDPRRRHISPLDEEAARLSSLVLDESVTDTVTPLVPRRPAMKVVTEPRTASGPRAERPLEPRRDGIDAGRDHADPRRDYIVERGRFVETRPQPPAAPREPAALQPPYLRPDERERPAPPAARGGAGAGYAPLPPPREIAIPPIELEEPVRRPADELSRPAAGAPAGLAESPAAPVQAYAGSPQDARADSERTDPARRSEGQVTSPEPVNATTAASGAEATAAAAGGTGPGADATTTARTENAEPARETSETADQAREAADQARQDGEHERGEHERVTGRHAEPEAATAESTAAAPEPAQEPEPAPQSVTAEDGDGQEAGRPAEAGDAQASPSTAARTTLSEPVETTGAVEAPVQGTAQDDAETPAETAETTAHTDEAGAAPSGPEERSAPVEPARPEPGPSAVEPEPESEPERKAESELKAEPQPESKEPEAKEPEAGGTEPTAAPRPAAQRAAAEPAPAAPVTPAARNRSRPDRGRRTQVPEQPAKPAAAEEQQPAQPAAAAVNGDPAPSAPKPAPRGRRKGSARGKRASVPSWDEIMFGARRPD